MSYLAMIQQYPKPGKKQKAQKHTRFEEKRITFTQDQRKRVFERFEGNCAYCGHEIYLDNFQVDHKIPKAKLREADFWDNLMPSCRACNIRKGTLSIERFRTELVRDTYQLDRDSAKFRLLQKYNLIVITNKEIEFYFEKVKRGIE